jgi:DNA-binding response OmpR family regulator
LTAAWLTDGISPKERTMYVLVWSNNQVLSDLVARNLRRRNFDVDARPLPATAGLGPIEECPAELAIVDLDCLEPELWRLAARLRAVIPETPFVILGHAWPTPARLYPLRPCTYVRKPFAIDELLDAVHDVRTAAGQWC